MTVSSTQKDAFWLRIIYITSALVCCAVAFLILGPRPVTGSAALDVSALPLVNASLNGLTACLLLVGWSLIKKKRFTQHRTVMLSAFASSTAFLISYVIYHWFKTGPRAYTGDFRALYLAILLSHIVLAIAILPLALLTLYRGASGALKKHRRIAKITLPLWLYVSATGVQIYVMLYT